MKDIQLQIQNITLPNFPNAIYKLVFTLHIPPNIIISIDLHTLENLKNLELAGKIPLDYR
jgi:sulfopyruvate decarboxylase TPP-binding subunit